MIQIDLSALKARNKLLTMFVLLCVLDAALISMAQDRWAIGRIILTIVVMYFALQGRKWAKWFLIGIFSLLAIGLIAMVLVLSSRLSILLIIGSFILSFLSEIIAIYMVGSKDLDRYFAYKRQANSA